MKNKELVEKLITNNLTLISVESLTAGLFSSSICEVPGASKIFKGAFVTYQSSFKTDALNIDSNLIFKWAYKLSSNKFIIVHNHPTGDSTPSIADIKITIDLVKKAKVISFEVIDHIIIGDDCFSMKRDLKDMKVF